MDYIPEPVDTSGVELPQDLQMLVERLAENAHEVWARKRVSEDWTYGPEKNAEHKQTPWLVPYCELPEAEKDTDRQVIRESVKAAYALGWRVKMLLEAHLEQGQHNPQRFATFDMDDQPELDAGVLEPFPGKRSRGGNPCNAPRFLMMFLGSAGKSW